MNSEAMEVYNKLIGTLDSMGWQYSRLEDEPGVRYTVNGDDIPMDIVIVIHPGVQLIRFLSILPVKFSEERQMDGIAAACAASHGLVFGAFSFHLKNRKIVYTASSIFLDSDVNSGWFRHQMDYVHAIVDTYNDRFLAVAKGYMGLDEFIRQTL